MIFNKPTNSNRFSSPSEPVVTPDTTETTPDFYNEPATETYSEPTTSRSLLPKSSNVLGRDVTISGELIFQNDLVIDGNVTGKISSVPTEGDSSTSGILTIGENADIHAEIKSRQAIIRGSVEGNITVTESITLGSTAKLFGDIIAQRLTVEPGATFIGHAQISADGITPPSRPGSTKPAEKA